MSLTEFYSVVEPLFADAQAELNLLLKILIPRNANRRANTWLCKRPSSLHHSKEFEREGSFGRLPKDYPLPVASGREETVGKELNDVWVAVVTGSEDCSFKVMRKNKYEEDLFDCEDERFEDDMLISSYRASIELLEGIQESAVSAQSKGEAFVLDERALSTIRLKAIRGLYEEAFDKIVEALHTRPLEIIPSMLTRLKHYVDSCLVHKTRQNEIWRSCCEQNFYRSLDHRSFYFRQSEKKNTNSKGSVSELRSVFGRCEEEV